MIHIISIVAILLCSGCASKLSVTYNSDPPGAVLYSGGKRYGYTPLTLNYEVTEKAKQLGFIYLADAKVQWISGAEAEIKSLKADIAKFGLYQQFTFNRPNGIPGRDSDIRFSLELDRTRAMQQQAAAAEDAAWEAGRASWAANNAAAESRRAKTAAKQARNILISNQ